jgi:hypothetical protein
MVSYVSLFSVRRIIFSLTAVYFVQVPFFSIAFLMASSLFQMSVQLSRHPMKTKSLQMLEIANESGIYITGYFMMFFSDWIEDVEFRYDLGNFYLPFFTLIFAINLS